LNYGNGASRWAGNGREIRSPTRQSFGRPGNIRRRTEASLAGCVNDSRRDVQKTG